MAIDVVHNQPSTIRMVFHLIFDWRSILMESNEQQQLFTDLSAEEAATVQGGRHYRAYRRHFVSYYYHNPYVSVSFRPRYSYNYGYYARPVSRFSVVIY
jgi:hypothetical protein